MLKVTLQRKLHCTLFYSIFVVALFAKIAFASATPENMCNMAAERAAQKTGVPVALFSEILAAGPASAKGIAHPWSVTLAGEPTLVFGTQDAAQAYVFTKFMRGGRQFSIGCFQLEYAPHAGAFASIEEMFDPDMNALRAAAELQALRAAHPSWRDALIAYRSRIFSLAVDEEHQRASKEVIT